MLRCQKQEAEGSHFEPQAQFSKPSHPRDMLSPRRPYPPKTHWGLSIQKPETVESISLKPPPQGSTVSPIQPSKQSVRETVSGQTLTPVLV